MKVYDVHAVAVMLPQLIEEARAGEEVIIARDDEPVVRLAPVQPRPKRRPGSLRGQIVIHDSFFDPMTDEELEAWGMG
jgi:antitoxin (DNA-binding transcriptional repressor) of toxin-antitoxin stability system